MTTSINPGIISWAMARSGFTRDSLAEAMKVNPDEVRRWEEGESPSFLTLEKLAYNYLNIPLAVFFFPEPPDIENPVRKFRRLPEYELARLSTDTIKIIHDSAAYQESLCELLPDDYFDTRLVDDIKANSFDGQGLAKQTRRYLDITMEQQFEFTGAEEAFKAWRHAIETVGIFTFKDTFKDRFISGFSLLHESYPIITVNNSNSFSRQVFTLAHELAHILFGVNGITDIDTSYFRYMGAADRTIETMCNQFASEFLVPATVFVDDIPTEFDPSIVPQLAFKYSVSREVILRKFLDYGIVSQDYYQQKSDEWNKDYLRTQPNIPGGNWYRTRLAYLGEGYTRLAYENFHQGRISIEQLGEHLHINSKNVTKLEAYLERFS